MAVTGGEPISAENLSGALGAIGAPKVDVVDGDGYTAALPRPASEYAVLFVKFTISSVSYLVVAAASPQNGESYSGAQSGTTSTGFSVVEDHVNGYAGGYLISKVVGITL